MHPCLKEMPVKSTAPTESWVDANRKARRIRKVLTMLRPVWPILASPISAHWTEDEALPMRPGLSGTRPDRAVASLGADTASLALETPWRAERPLGSVEQR